LEFNKAPNVIDPTRKRVLENALLAQGHLISFQASSVDSSVKRRKMSRSLSSQTMHNDKGNKDQALVAKFKRLPGRLRPVRTQRSLNERRCSLLSSSFA
jgi:hypothetical protein